MKKNKFHDLQQGSMSVNEYINKFAQLSRYAPENVVTDNARQKCFKRGLNPSLKTQVVGNDYVDFQHMVDKVVLIEESRCELEESCKRKMMQHGSHQNRPQRLRMNVQHLVHFTPPAALFQDSTTSTKTTTNLREATIQLQESPVTTTMRQVIMPTVAHESKPQRQFYSTQELHHLEPLHQDSTSIHKRTSETCHRRASPISSRASHQRSPQSIQHLLQFYLAQKRKSLGRPSKNSSSRTYSLASPNLEIEILFNRGRFVTSQFSCLFEIFKINRIS